MVKRLVAAVGLVFAASATAALAATTVGVGGVAPVTTGAQAGGNGIPIGGSVHIGTDPGNPLPLCVAPYIAEAGGKPLVNPGQICPLGGGPANPGPSPAVNLNEQSNLNNPLPVCVHPYIHRAGQPPIVDATICLPPG
jgi:hypothetical protein